MQIQQGKEGKCFHQADVRFALFRHLGPFVRATSPYELIFDDTLGSFRWQIPECVDTADGKIENSRPSIIDPEIEHTLKEGE